MHVHLEAHIRLYGPSKESKERPSRILLVADGERMSLLRKLPTATRKEYFLFMRKVLMD